MHIHINMWGKALRVIPRVSKQEWADLDPIAKWLIASRSAVFVMTAFSVLVGGLLAAADDKFEIGRFVLCLIGLVFAHAANNLLNDYTDSVRGVDKDNYFRTLYGPQTLENGLWSKKTLLSVIAFTALIAAVCGLWLVALIGTSILWPMALGAFFLLFYTWPLKYIGLGEPTVMAVWGPLMVGGTYLALTGHWSWEVALIGAVYAFGPTTVLLGKHTDKRAEDKPKRIYTLPVIIGEKAARYSVIALILLQPLLVVTLVATETIKPGLLVALLGIPMILRTVKVFLQPRPTTKPKDFPDQFWPTYLAGYAFRCNRITGSLFVLGLVINLFW